MSEAKSDAVIEALALEAGMDPKNWRQELSERSKTNYFTLAKYVGKNPRPLSKSVAEALADFFTRELGRQVTVDTLMGRSVKNVELIKDVKELIQVPILGTVRAGKPLYASENIVGYENVAAEAVKNGEFFYLEITGDSMIGAKIFPGGRVLVRRQDWVDNNQVAVVIVNGDEATVKRVKWLGDQVILYAANPSYEPQIYDVRDVVVLGRVVKSEVSL